MRKHVLIASSVCVLPFMLFVFHATTHFFGYKNGYLFGMGIYWCYCLLFICALSKGNNVFSKLKISVNSKKEILYLLIILAPVVGAFYVNFLPYIADITYKVAALVLVTAVINGTIEELYWRGLYMVEFQKRIFINIGLASFLFGLWHVAIYSITEMAFFGFAPLVFGSALIGSLWAFCNRKFQSVLPSIVGHVLLNTFAFTGLYLENGF